jgi:hypothetical protein
LDERSSGCVIPTVSFSGHTLDEAMVVEQLAIAPGAVLRAAVRVQ